MHRGDFVGHVSCGSGQYPTFSFKSGQFLTFNKLLISQHELTFIFGAFCCWIPYKMWNLFYAKNSGRNFWGILLYIANVRHYLWSHRFIYFFIFFFCQVDLLFSLNFTGYLMTTLFMLVIVNYSMLKCASWLVFLQFFFWFAHFSYFCM